MPCKRPPTVATKTKKIAFDLLCISQEYLPGQAVLDTARSSEEPVKSVHLFASDRTLRANLGEKVPSAGGLAKWSEDDHCMRYWAVLRQDFHRPEGLLHLWLDGVSGGGDSNEIYIAWRARMNLVGIPPIHVLETHF